MSAIYIYKTFLLEGDRMRESLTRSFHICLSSCFAVTVFQQNGHINLLAEQGDVRKPHTIFHSQTHEAPEPGWTFSSSVLYDEGKSSSRRIHFRCFNLIIYLDNEFCSMYREWRSKMPTSGWLTILWRFVVLYNNFEANEALTDEAKH